METIVSGPATSTPAGERVWAGSQDHTDDTLYYDEETYDSKEGSETYYEYTYGDVEYTDRSQSELDVTRDSIDLEWDELQDAHYEEEDENLVSSWEQQCNEAKQLRRWAKVTISKELREFEEYMRVQRHPRDVKCRKLKTKSALNDIAEECEWLRNKVNKFNERNTTIPFNELIFKIMETRHLVTAANIDLDTITLAGSNPEIKYGQYEISEIHGEHTALHPVTPREMVQNNIKRSLANNEKNQKLTKSLMKSIVDPCPS